MTKRPACFNQRVSLYRRGPPALLVGERRSVGDGLGLHCRFEGLDIVRRHLRPVNIDRQFVELGDQRERRRLTQRLVLPRITRVSGLPVAHDTVGRPDDRIHYPAETTGRQRFAEN